MLPSPERPQRGADLLDLRIGQLWINGEADDFSNCYAGNAAPVRAEGYAVAVGSLLVHRQTVMHGRPHPSVSQTRTYSVAVLYA